MWNTNEEIMDKCNHPVTRYKEDQQGQWCVICGEKVFDVEKEVCSKCKHSKKLFDGWVCCKYLMTIIPDMNVTFKIKDGSCFEKRA
jgi:ribosomal protein L37E